MSKTRGLDPDPEDMRRLGHQTIDWLVDHWARLSELPVADLRGTEELRRSLAEELPENGSPLADSLLFLQQRVVPNMTHVSHPRFHAYIPAPGSFYGTLGVLLSGGLNPFVGSSLGGASFSALELETLRWVSEAVGYPREAEGIFTSGGSLANLGALAAADATVERATANEARADRGPKEAKCGIPRSRRRIYVSQHGHASMVKAASVLGFDDRSVQYLATDCNLRIDVEAARRLINRDLEAGNLPLFLCANAGTTNTGVIDLLSELADLCAEYRVWFHVDGAYGGFAALSRAARPLFEGMNRADSLTLDPHKWLYTPMGHGCLLVQRQGALAAAFSATGDYLRDVSRQEVNFFDRGPELSRSARALPVWLLMRTVGLEALRREVDHDLELAAQVEKLLAEDSLFEVVSRHLSVVVFRLAGLRDESEQSRSQRELNLVQRLLRGGETLVSGTILEGRSALRFVVMNHRTQAEDVRRSVEALHEAAQS